MSQRFFIRSAGAILLMAALTRFVIAVGDAQALSLPEPVFGIPLRYAVLLVGGLELAVALISLFGKQPGLQSAWLAWLSTDYIVFRIGLLVLNYDPQATCIGALTDPLHLSGGIPGLIITLLPIYLLAGSFASVTVSWDLARAARAAATITTPSLQETNTPLLKMACPGCATHIQFAAQNLGQITRCPRCQTPITLCECSSSNNPTIQQSNNPVPAIHHSIAPVSVSSITPSLRPSTTPFLKMACIFCKEHIEFPSYALGRKVSCPHCNKDITLQTSS